MKPYGDTANLLLVELTLRISAIKSLLVKKGIITEAEFDAEISEIEHKITDVFSGAEKLVPPSESKPRMN